ncbi:hypothetical protein B1C81_23000 [Streptomyces sp. HG99]|nr:hypothetical protein B1C81_23000 [Streptomyces sp. HG99]
MAGHLTLDWENLTSSSDPDKQLVVWTAEPGTPSHDGLLLLASWVATNESAGPGTHPASPDTPGRPSLTGRPLPPAG